MAATNSKLDCWYEKSRAEGIDKQFIKFLPDLSKRLIILLQDINKLMLDYVNNNYQEPEKASILLASTEHEEYLKSIG
jgi:hypothetical protein